MIAFRCLFLNGTYQAAEPGSIAEPELIPHPARFHAALVAAGWAIGGDSFPTDGLAALEWLERLGPPALAYPVGISVRTAPSVFVPRNLTGQEVGDVVNAIRAKRNSSRLSGRVVRSFPTSIPGDAPVWFIWNVDENPHRAALHRLACEMQYLGSSRSPVCCDLVDDPPEPMLAPARSGGGRALRVARSGFTQALIAARHTYPPAITPSFVAYDTAEQLEPQQTEDAGPFADLLMRALDKRFPLTILHAAALTRALREAVLSRAGDDAPAVLHGHGCNPHVAFLALANVGNTHADGRLLGVAVAIPRGATPAERSAIVGAVESVDALHNVGVGGPWTLHPAAERSIRTLDPARWIGPACRWQTATPVILDRYPKRHEPAAVETAIRATIRHAGLPDPVTVSCSPIPSQAAAVPGPAYTGNGLPGGLRLHVDMRFSQPLRGPVLAGRGRYFGVGLFVPVPDSGSDRRGDG